MMSRECEQGGIVINFSIEKIIGQNIRAARERQGMTQEYLATRLQLEGCDITRSAIAKIEVGQRHLYPDELILMRKILDTPYDELLNIITNQP